jgi:hypothetical protein
MRGTLVTDLRHGLTADGAVAPMPSQARRLVEFLTKIVAEATSTQSDHGAAAVQCRRRPARRACPGMIEMEFDSEAMIAWRCPVCGDNGLIRNWEGTLWDRSKDARPH